MMRRMRNGAPIFGLLYWTRSIVFFTCPATEQVSWDPTADTFVCVISHFQILGCAAYLRVRRETGEKLIGTIIRLTA
ncbi:hypothetical protein EV424DRAFT_1415515 [Suillus variegatus]|nr:hypothetical protein EV424DRAFT_1415515 [Suillus variegatus]